MRPTEFYRAHFDIRLREPDFESAVIHVIRPMRLEILAPADISLCDYMPEPYVRTCSLRIDPERVPSEELARRLDRLAADPRWLPWVDTVEFHLVHPDYLTQIGGREFHALSTRMNHLLCDSYLELQGESGEAPVKNRGLIASASTLLVLKALRLDPEEIRACLKFHVRDLAEFHRVELDATGVAESVGSNLDAQAAIREFFPELGIDWTALDRALTESQIASLRTLDASLQKVCRSHSPTDVAKWTRPLDWAIKKSVTHGIWGRFMIENFTEIAYLGALCG